MMLAFLILCLVFFLAINIGVLLWAASILGSWRAPYVPLPHEALPGIVKALQLAKGNVVYDIGCGDGRILRSCAAQQPECTYKGIERAWYPYILARLCGKSSIQYIRGDAFAQSYADANVIVLYLLPGFIDKIGEKLFRECAPGTRIVTVDFPFTFCEPQQCIEQHHLSSRMRGRMISVYELPKKAS